MALYVRYSQRLGRYGRFTEWTKTKLMRLNVDSVCGSSGDDLRWLHYKSFPSFLVLDFSLSLSLSLFFFLFLSDFFFLVV